MEDINKSKVIKLVAQALQFDPQRKNAVFFGLVDIIKKAASPDQAAAIILDEFDDLLKTAAVDIIEAVDTDALVPYVPGKKGPIFHRVG